MGTVTLVLVASDLVGVVYYHWYLDGAWVGSGTAASFSFAMELGSQARVDCVDTLAPAFDPLAAAPAFFPARFTIHWVRSLATDVASYRIEQSPDGAAWTAIAEFPHDEEAWDYRFLTERLTDLASLVWRVIPVDIAGNDGTPLIIGPPIQGEWSGIYLPVKVVRVPDAPDWSFTWNAGTQRVTYAAA